MTNVNPNPVAPQNSAPVQGTQTSAAQTGVHREADDTEEIYYEGSPLMRGALGKGFLWIFGGVLLIALAIALPILKPHVVPWWVYLVVAIIGLILIMVPLIRSKTIRYRISNYRIDYERGLFSKDIDTLELWHVEDIRFHQSLIDRMLGIGNITVVSRDEQLPQLVMHDIPQARPLFETLKQRIISVKRQRGVIKVDPG